MALVADIRRPSPTPPPSTPPSAPPTSPSRRCATPASAPPAARAELSAAAGLTERATEVAEQAQHVPVLALNRSLELAGKA